MSRRSAALAPAFADGKLQLLRQELLLLDQVLHALRWSGPDAALDVIDGWVPKVAAVRRPSPQRRSRSIAVVGALLAGLTSEDVDDSRALRT